MLKNTKAKIRFALTTILLLILCMSFFSGCSKNTNEDTTASDETSSDTTISIYESEDYDTTWNENDSIAVVLKTNAISCESNGVKIDENTITITSAGSYVISGSLENGQIIVDTEDEEIVKLALDGVNISCNTSSPIYIENANKTIIVLPDGSENYLSDGDTYSTNTDGEPDATIFSKSDLTINGTGSLSIDANYDDGIKSKDTLIITGGNISIEAVGSGIVGKDYVAITDSDISILSEGDGIKSTNDIDSSLGFIQIDSGSIDITSKNEGLQAKTNITINGGNITINSGGGSTNSINNSESTWYGKEPGNSQTSNVDSDTSGKGIVAKNNITINEGIIEIDSADDAIHANETIEISGGNITISAGDDGIHADTSIDINNGTINILESYEGIESATITIEDGDIHIVSNDDGINCAGGNDDSSGGGRPGENNINSSGNDYLYINGGYIYVNATGDGLDINGSIAISAGTIIISGPTSSGNGALDYDGLFEMSGGFLLAAGSAGMSQTPDSSSEQYSVSITFNSYLEANTILHIENDSGEDIVTFYAEKPYQNVVLCSVDLMQNVEYSIEYGGSCTGSVTDGLYSGGVYSNGTAVTTFTLSGVITYLGSSGSNQMH